MVQCRTILKTIDFSMSIAGKFINSFTKLFSFIGLSVFTFFNIVQVNGQGQHNSDYYVQNNDTTRCTHLIFFSGDTCKKLKWYDRDGIATTLNCIAENGVTAFGMNGRDYELVEIKNEKKRYLWKKIDGMISLYVQDFTETQWYDQNMPETETQKFVKLHDNLYHIRNKRNIQQILLPTFSACEGFRSGYYGKFSMDELDNMIKVYNANCVYEPNNDFRENSDYIVDMQGDTVFCHSVEIRRSTGFVNEIRYTVPAGRVYTISGRNNCEQYRSFSINKQVFDLIPLKPGEPGRGKMHVWRKINGRIKLYDYFREMRGMERPLNTNPAGGTDEIIYTVQLEDDIYVEVTDKKLNKTIMPFLLKCESFTELFKDEVTSEREVFELVIKLFNQHCPQND